MVSPWLPGYEHQLVQGAGLSVSAGAPKVVLHTTETARPSLETLIRHWQGNWGSGLPHFIVEGSRVVQLLPLDVGAYTLENKPGGADTNRSGPAIQAEIVSRAAEDWDDETYEAVGRLLADIKRAGHDFDLGLYPRFYGANEGIVLASYNSPIRMSAQEYIDFGGWTDHAHCPENSHWDIGQKDGPRLERIARAHYDPTPEPVPEDEDDMAKTVMVYDTRGGQVWQMEYPNGMFKQYVESGAQMGILQQTSCPFVGEGNLDLIDARATYPPDATPATFTLTQEQVEQLGTLTQEQITSLASLTAAETAALLAERLQG